MRKLEWPTTQEEWERLVTSLLKANLQLADMNYIDLARELRKIGVVYDHKNISAKIKKGRFPAVFFLQALACAGVTVLQLPSPPDPKEPGEQTDS